MIMLYAMPVTQFHSITYMQKILTKKNIKSINYKKG